LKERSKPVNAALKRWAPLPLALLLALMAGPLGCGGEGGGGGSSGGGGEGEELAAGSCGAPFDFEALRRYHGPIPYAGGSIADGEAAVVGSCGGEGREQVFRWVAPRDGKVGFRLAEGDPRLTIHVRSRCVDEETERFCAPGDRLLVLAVEKDEILDVIVDSRPNHDVHFEVGVIFEASQLEEGEVCRLDASTGPCAEGLACDPKEGKCLVPPEPVRPILHAAHARLEEGRVIFQVEGTAPNRNVYAMELRFFDEGGEAVQVLGTEELAADISEEAYGKEEFNAEAWVGQEEIAGAATVKIWLLDSKLVASNSMEVSLPRSEDAAPPEGQN